MHYLSIHSNPLLSVVSEHFYVTTFLIHIYQQDKQLLCHHSGSILESVSPLPCSSNNFTGENLDCMGAELDTHTKTETMLKVHMYDICTEDSSSIIP